MNFEQLLYKSVFEELLLARLHNKYLMQSLETELGTKIFRDRDETWDIRDRDSKNRSRDFRDLITASGHLR